MPIQLDKILADIANEKFLHPNYPNANKKDVDDAWLRVGKNNKLSVHEARSIFKVLQKKYDQEKAKETSSWKLFNIMDQIHRKIEIQIEEKPDDECELPLEEDEEYEMLEVQEDDEPMICHTLPPASTGSTSDNDSPTKSRSSSIDSHDKDEKNVITITTTRQQNNLTPNNLNNSNYTSVSSTQSEEKKLLNTLAGSSSVTRLQQQQLQQQQQQNSTHTQASSAQQQNSAVTAVTLHKKGITLKKTTPATVGCTTIFTKTHASGNNTTTTTTPLKSTTLRSTASGIQVTETIKRKYNNDEQQQSKKIQLLQTTPTAKSITSSTATATTTTPQQITTTAQLMQIKNELNDERLNNDVHSNLNSLGINLITIPGNADLANGIITGHGVSVGGSGAGAGVGVGPSSSTAATVASTSTNGYSPRLDEIDFKNDIIFEPTGVINNVTNKNNRNNSGEIINLGNFDNSLPPTFFKNLCNSTRHEALGLYIANVMNRLRPRTAAKLELEILRAIIDAKSDELEQ